MCQPFYKFLSDYNFIVTLTQINGIPISIFKFFLFDQKVFMQLAMCLIQALVGWCQTNRLKYQKPVERAFYEAIRERHSERAASRFILKLVRVDSDLCELK